MKSYKLPKVLVLDYKKWICGKSLWKAPVDGGYHGAGRSALLNHKGYMCCLGQFSMQAGIQKDLLLDCSMPSELDTKVQGLMTNQYDNNVTATNAAEINDSPNTTIVQKVKALRRLFGKNGRKIKLKNFPKSILKELE